MKVKKGYTFDDVLLVPRHSNVKSRSDLDTSVDLGYNVKLKIPIVSANMKTITGHKMAQKLTQLGGLPILHRFFDTQDEYVEEFKLATKYGINVGVSVGVQSSYPILDKFYDLGCRIFCVDVAHADNKYVVESTGWIKRTFPDVLLISGNIATTDAAMRLSDAGADVLKLNIGNGSLCTTRVQTGNGVPTLTAISEIHNARERGYIRGDVKLICDGGMRTSGDIVKALCFTECVMIGGLLAGSDETPGEPYCVPHGNWYKSYEGSSTHKTNHIEGVKTSVRCTGPVETIIKELMEGVRSGMSYQGAETLSELQDSPEFVEVSGAGLVENHPHKLLEKD